MKILITFLLFLSSCTIHAQDKQIIDVHKSQKSFQVTLPGNATTGYEWSVMSYDNQLVHLSESHYQAPNTKLIGAGGNMIFTFNLNKGKTYPAQTDMVFKYARSWEPKSGMLKHVVVRFVD